MKGSNNGRMEFTLNEEWKRDLKRKKEELIRDEGGNERNEEVWENLYRENEERELKI